MHLSMPTLLFAGIVTLFLVLVDGGVALIILSTYPGDALWQRMFKDIGAALVASGPFIFIIQLWGWAEAQERNSQHPTQAQNDDGAAHPEDGPAR